MLTYAGTFETYRRILTDAYVETIWRYGDTDMNITSLYQIDTFRVRGKKLHEAAKYQSALQLLVDLQVPEVKILNICIFFYQ